MDDFYKADYTIRIDAESEYGHGTVRVLMLEPNHNPDLVLIGLQKIRNKLKRRYYLISMK